VIAKP